MKYLFLVLCLGFLGCATKVQAPLVKIAEKQEGPKVVLGQCYANTAGTVLLFFADNPDGSVEIIPAPIMSTGCRCVVIVNDEPFLSINPLPDVFCEEEKAEEPNDEN